MSTSSLNQTIEIETRPDTRPGRDEFLANYINEQKSRSANDLVWVSAALSIFGIFVLSIPFQVASLMLIASFLFRRNRLTRGGLVCGCLIGIWNVGFLVSSIYALLSNPLTA